MRPMVFRWRLLLLLWLALGLGWWKGPTIGSQLQVWWQRHQFLLEGYENAIPSLTYLLTTNPGPNAPRGLDFCLPSETPFIKIISNASLSQERERLGITNQEWRYVLGYRLLDANDTELKHGRYHHRTELSLQTNRLTGRPITPNYYLEKHLTPLDSRQILINLTESNLMNRVGKVHLWLDSADSGIGEVGLRVYGQAEVAARKLKYLWNRLSVEQKQDLARGNVYSYHGLSEQEKVSLLRHHWSGIAPEGVAGRDYRRRTLFVRDDFERRNALSGLEENATSGFRMDARRWATVELPLGHGRIQFDLSTPNPPAANLTHRLNLNWHGTRLEKPGSELIAWTNVTHRIWATNRPGLLELVPAQETVVRLYHEDAGQTNEITPVPLLVAAYWVEPGSSLTFDISHVPEENTGFRIDLRIVPQTQFDAQERLGHARFALANSDGQWIQTGVLTVSNQPSRLDQYIRQDQATNVTEPSSWFFSLPAQIASVQLTAMDLPLVVHAYNRPAGLAKRVRVPEEYAAAGPEAPAQPTWFSLRAREHDQGLSGGQVGWLATLPQPPAYDDRLLSGQYQWESFAPTPSGSARMLLTPAPADEAKRPEMRPYLFHRIPVGRSLSIRLQGALAETELSPSLILTSESPGFPEGLDRGVTLTWDDQVQPRILLQPGVTEVRLPSWGVGEHRLQIQCLGPVEAFLNYLQTDQPATWLKRVGYLTQTHPVCFAVDKQQSGDELLVLRLFSPVDEPSGCQVRTVLRGPKTGRAAGLGPFTGHTLARHVFEVTGPGPAASIVLGAANQRLDAGQLLFVPLAADLEPGRYELEATFQSARPRLAVLSRVTPGDFETRSLRLNPK